MPTTTIRQQVVQLLGKKSGKDPKQDAGLFVDASRLWEDLGLADETRALLAPGLQDIARQTNPAATISRQECVKLGTVGATVALVKKRAAPPSITSANKEE